MDLTNHQRLPASRLATKPESRGQPNPTSSGPSRHSAILSHADQLYGSAWTELTSTSSAARRRSAFGASLATSFGRASKASGDVGDSERSRSAFLRGRNLDFSGVRSRWAAGVKIAHAQVQKEAVVIEETPLVRSKLLEKLLSVNVLPWSVFGAEKLARLFL